MPALLQKLAKGARVAADARFRRGLVHGVAATIEHAAALRDLDVSTAVDVGANRGQFTLLIAGLFPTARIFAFEPLQGAFSVLQAVTASLPRVEVFDVGIAPARGEMPLHVARASDSSSLLPITDRQTMLFPGTGLTRVEPVRVGPLDDFVSPEQLTGPTLLKIDVQGYELEVLQSARRLLPHVDAVYVEASFVTLYDGQALADRVVDHLHGNGLRLSGVFNLNHHHGRAIQADFLFQRG
jgi:FkbM family methyltransferase